MHYEILICIPIHWLITLLLYKLGNFSQKGFIDLTKLEHELVKNAPSVMLLWMFLIFIIRFLEPTALSFFKHSEPDGFPLPARITIFLFYFVTNQYLLVLMKWGVKNNYYRRRRIYSTFPGIFLLGMLTSIFFEQ